LPAGPRCRFAAIESLARLSALIASPEWRRWRRFVLGGGSNLILSGDFDGWCCTCGFQAELVGDDADAWTVRAEQGSWHDFVRWTLARGWPGLENLSLIPGTVGAAPIQNIGATAGDAERFLRLEAVIWKRARRSC